MLEESKPTVHDRWAHLRFSVIGPLLAAPPGPGKLAEEIKKLSGKTWLHPITGKPTRFGFSTIERWYHRARRAKVDPVGVLRRKIRSDLGRQPAVGQKLKAVLLDQYKAHRSWSYQLHYDNLAAVVAADAEIGPMPSYPTLRRFMKTNGLLRRRRLSSTDTAGVRRAEARLDEREVRSYEAEYVQGLWHLDFHHGSKKVLLSSGEWMTPLVLGILDDRSRLACHVQWYLAETAENLVHGLSQAIQKRALPRSLMTDNGAAMIAGETTQGLLRLGIVHQTTLPYSAYQNGKQENFWAQLEGRMMAMLEGTKDLTLPFLNESTQAWVEMEYNRKVHSETGQTPIVRYLAGPDVGRESPDSNALRLAFMTEERRTQRRSDCTVTIEGRRFEVPTRYRSLERVTVRYAGWDLAHVYLIDERSGTVLCRLYPLDKAKNADGKRRRLPEGMVAMVDRPIEPAPGVAPLLKRLMAEYAATGLPPAYLPKEETDREESDSQKTEDPR
jgi:transposase InsO family protein